MISIRLKGTSQIADHLLWPKFSNKAKYDLIDIEMWFFVENGKGIFWCDWIVLTELDGEKALYFLGKIQLFRPQCNTTCFCNWLWLGKTYLGNEVPWDLKEIPSGHSTRDLDLLASKNIWHRSLLYIDPNIIIIVFDCLLKLHSAVV